MHLPRPQANLRTARLGEGDPSSLRDEIQQHSAAMDVDRQAALEAERVDDASKLPDELEVLGVVAKPTDTLKVLREACTLAGLGKSGGKETVYRRLHNFAETTKSASRCIPDRS